MRKTLLILIFSICALASSIAQTKFPLETKNYHLELSFDFEEGILNGVAKITISNQSDSNVPEIPLLLYRLMNVSSITDQSGSNISFSQNVVQFSDFEKLQVNYITIQQNLLPHETKTITLQYKGYLLGYSETGMKYITDKISPEFTLIREDSYAYPSLGQPSISLLQQVVSSSNYNYTLKVIVPDSLVVVNGGILESKNPEANNLISYQYKSKKPNWRIDIAIAAYKEIKNERLNVYYYNDSIAAQNIIEYGIKAFSLYEDWWGKLKKSNIMTVIETEKGSGGQTDETTILLPGEAIGGENFEYLFHEISHLWNVRIKEKQGLSPRWEEGLAMFCQYLLSENLNAGKKGLVKRIVNSNLKWLRNTLTENQKLANVPMIEYGNEQLTDYSYNQGMIMFAILYYWFGQEIFNNVIGGFYQKYYVTGASTKEFVDHWEEVTNSKKVQSFFNDWIYSTNYKNVISDGKTIDNIIDYYKLAK